MPNALAIDWSVWQRNPVVSWVWEGASACVIFQKPPLAVCPLATLGKMAIVGDFEECRPENLFIYSPAGVILRKYSAPALGSNPQFGWIKEVGGALEVGISYQDDQGQ